jgi:ABC-type amino acid transport substrate-binding protein
MDDEVLVRRLRQVDGGAEPDSAFLDRMYEELAAEVGFRARRQTATSSARVARGLLLRLLAAAILLGLALLGTLLAGAYLERQRDLDQHPLSRIRATGTVRVATRPDFPQVTIDGRSQGGFDEDVARAIADRMGVTSRFTDGATTLDGPRSTWDIALPSVGLDPSAAEAFDLSDPYYSWPVLIVVAGDSTISSLDELAGRRVCAVSGSPAARWLGGPSGGLSGELQRPPGSLVIVEHESDDACFGALEQDDVAAVATSMTTAPAIDSRPTVRRLDGPVVLEDRRIVAGRGPGSDALIAEIDRLLGELRADGTLAELSRRRFGGEDMTGGQP